jgi:hypothetical protein
MKMTTATQPTAKHSYQVGDILVSSWGYDQTNVFFYEVVKATAATVRVRRRNASIASSGNMSGYSVPAEGFHDSETLSRTVKDDAIKIESFERAYRWNGKPQHCSWYA